MSDLERLLRQYRSQPNDATLIACLTAYRREGLEAPTFLAEAAAKRSSEWVRQILARKGIRYYVHSWFSDARRKHMREYRALVTNGRGREVRLKRQHLREGLPAKLSDKTLRWWARSHANSGDVIALPWVPGVDTVFEIWSALNEGPKRKVSMEGETLPLFAGEASDE